MHAREVPNGRKRSRVRFDAFDAAPKGRTSDVSCIFEGVVLTDTVQQPSVSAESGAGRLATVDSTAAVAAAIAKLQ